MIMKKVYLLVHNTTLTPEKIPIIEVYAKKEMAEAEEKELKKNFPHNCNIIKVLEKQVKVF